ncbi:hypothetical protein CTI12_AA546890 [Artemisia annua]|uniref:Uncharacterized protein n=1 Tax=Artemisia annua TaxID=35608 RepID=A0A2U1KZM8_ARTAN|nr:hypothetical protein CTI12_AA546890 [Artemisia annua]
MAFGENRGSKYVHIQLIHLKAIASLIDSAINKEFQLRYVDLQHDPPQMVTEIERSPVGAQFLSLQKLFSAPPSEVIDLSYLMQDTLVNLPTLNGWLLGYPVVYIFGKDHIEDVVYNLSTKLLHLFSIFVRRDIGEEEKEYLWVQEWI